MSVFENYADLYDLFYSDKDYRAECDYVIDLTEKYSKGPVRSILDIGCGTGGHALTWAQDGLQVMGLDRSIKMLIHARKKAEEMKISLPFVEGDIRDFDLGKKFDAVTAMFAVMSYQTYTEDILSSLRSVRRHLEPGGLFLFDAWSGPGVLSNPPRERVSSFWKENTEILRTVQPEHDVNRHIVEVHYDILCIKDDKIVQRIKEIHPMRYLFHREVADYAEETGFEMVACKPFMKQEETLRVNDWNVMFVLKAV
ncbi:MAG TPA: class I SAM-dependent methyltransferase [Nitrospirae bacterium]|nr:class I SAM-dependent methyltransferase [Nitrospirota bacterium]